MCDFCIPFVKSECPLGSAWELTLDRAHVPPPSRFHARPVTSLSYDQLQALPVKELKAYISAFNIPIPYVHLLVRRGRVGHLHLLTGSPLRHVTSPSAGWVCTRSPSMSTSCSEPGPRTDVSPHETKSVDTLLRFWPPPKLTYACWPPLCGRLTFATRPSRQHQRTAHHHPIPSVVSSPTSPTLPRLRPLDGRLNPQAQPNLRLGRPTWLPIPRHLIAPILRTHSPQTALDRPDVQLLPHHRLRPRRRPLGLARLRRLSDRYPSRPHPPLEPRHPDHHLPKHDLLHLVHLSHQIRLRRPHPSVRQRWLNSFSSSPNRPTPTPSCPTSPSESLNPSSRRTMSAPMEFSRSPSSSTRLPGSSRPRATDSDGWRPRREERLWQRQRAV